MPIVRKQLKPSDVYPENIRYDADTDTVQSLVNDEWVDNPDADPRNQTTFPPRITANTACDAAESVKDAFKGQIDGILTAIDGAATTFTIAGLVLGLFTFGVFEIFIALALAAANAMIDAGTTALSAALTDPVYHQLACILDCHMDSSGRLNVGSLPAVESDVTDQIGGLAATILNLFLSLAGEGGINNLASLGTSTGSCGDCGCAPPCIDWIVVTGTLVGTVGENEMIISSEYVVANSRYEAVISNQVSQGGTGSCCYVSGVDLGGATESFYTVQCSGAEGSYSPEGLVCIAFAAFGSPTPFTMTVVFG